MNSIRFFSPDGGQIAFVREFKDYGEVILIPSLGGAERRVARLFSGNYSISFAPDGATIAVVDAEDSSASAPDRQFCIYLIDLKTGAKRRLTMPADFAGETTPRFAPDGRNLAFVRNFRDGTQDLFVVPTGGGEPRRLTSDQKTIHSLAWSPDADEIFFVSYRESNRTSIWRIAATGGTPEVLATGGKGITNIAASPDGKRIAFVENQIQSDIWQIELGKGDLLPRKFIVTNHSEDSPEISPDGKHVLFMSDRSGKRSAWLADADGKNVRQLTDAALLVSEARFSPDGSRIVLTVSDGRRQDVYTQAFEGGGTRRLTLGGERNFAPVWSVDNRWLYFVSDRTGANEVWRMRSDGDDSSAQQITRRGGAQAAFPTPDGATIFFGKQDSTDLWQAAADGGDTRAEKTAPEFAAAGFSGIWTGTRGGIYFLARDANGSRQIKFYDFADKKIKIAVANPNLPESLHGSLAPAFNEMKILFTTQNRNASNIVLAELP